jgi:hypothetical protein
MKRMVTETEDAFERTLLRSARLDVHPKNGAREVALALAASAANLPARSGSPDAGRFGAEPAIATKVGALSWKWLGVGVVVGGVAGAGAMAGYQHVHVSRATTAPTPAAPVAVVTMAPLSAPLEVVPEPTVVGTSATLRAKAPPPAGPVASGISAASAQPVAPAPENASTLASEAAAIDRARRALAAGSASTAIELLDRYERESPTHALAPDALALRIQAEKARGNDARAKQLAETFLASHPNDPHADRVRRLLSSSHGP